MTECSRCGLDVDVEGWLTVEEHETEFTLELCGLCKDKVREFIEQGV